MANALENRGSLVIKKLGILFYFLGISYAFSQIPPLPDTLKSRLPTLLKFAVRSTQDLPKNRLIFQSIDSQNADWLAVYFAINVENHTKNDATENIVATISEAINLFNDSGKLIRVAFQTDIHYPDPDNPSKTLSKSLGEVGIEPPITKPQPISLKFYNGNDPRWKNEWKSTMDGPNKKPVGRSFGRIKEGYARINIDDRRSDASYTILHELAHLVLLNVDTYYEDSSSIFTPQEAEELSFFNASNSRLPLHPLEIVFGLMPYTQTAPGWYDYLGNAKDHRMFYLEKKNAITKFVYNIKATPSTLPQSLDISWINMGDQELKHSEKIIDQDPTPGQSMEIELPAIQKVGIYIFHVRVGYQVLSNCTQCEPSYNYRSFIFKAVLTPDQPWMISY